VKADPSNNGWQRDLSVSLNRIGNALAAQAKFVEALEAFREDLVMAEQLAKADPANTD
jgi:hypothetical protein